MRRGRRQGGQHVAGNPLRMRTDASLCLPPMPPPAPTPGRVGLAQEGKPGFRAALFSAQAAKYAKFRPHYPDYVREALLPGCGGGGAHLLRALANSCCAPAPPCTNLRSTSASTSLRRPPLATSRGNAAASLRWMWVAGRATWRSSWRAASPRSSASTPASISWRTPSRHGGTSGSGEPARRMHACMHAAALGAAGDPPQPHFVVALFTLCACPPAAARRRPTFGTSPRRRSCCQRCCHAAQST